MRGRLQLLLTQYVDAQQQTNRMLEKIAALMVSNQLLQECIDHEGKPRLPDEIAELVADSFSAGLCLLNELEQRNKDFDYQKREFFIEDTEMDDDQDADDNKQSLGSF